MKENINNEPRASKEILKANKTGYFTIGLLNNKVPANLGTLFRHAYAR